MNVIFLTMSIITDVCMSGIYTDLMRKFRDCGHNVCVVTPCQRSEGKPTSLIDSEGIKVLRVRTLNVQKTKSVVEKGIGQLSIDYLYKRAIKKYFCDIDFDLILYSTPPITLLSSIKYVKKCNPNAKTYLMLKDIFPQNAVDIGMLSTKGVKGLLYRNFRRKEKELYDISDFIGCMSPANVKYLLEYNSDIKQEKVGVCPNSYDASSIVHIFDEERLDMRRKYSLPIDKTVFIYGGNLGKPQGIPFLIECLNASKDREDCHFVVVGDGTEYSKLVSWYSENKPRNVSLFRRLPKADYDRLANACDVGLIFLDFRFTIPNYPSRLLPYLMNKMSIIASTDTVSDIGRIAEENGYGYWCPSNDVKAFIGVLDKMLKSDIKQMGENGYNFYLKNYTVQNTYEAIINAI